MAEHGVTKKGFVIKRLDEILEEIHTDLTDGYGFNTRMDPQSFLNVLIVTFGYKISELWEVAQNSYYAKYPSTAEGVSLDNAVQYGGIRRGPNKYSYYKLHCTGLEGTTVRQGAVVATNTAPQMRFQATSEFEITRSAFNRVALKVATEEEGQIYSVSINGTQYSYTSESEDALSILNGLADSISIEGYAVKVDAESIVLTIEDLNVARVNALVLSDNLTTSSITVLADFATTVYGKYIFPDRTITEIITVITGFNSVENLITPIYGQLQETDVELRHTYISRSAIRSNRMVDSICAQLLTKVANVESVAGYENDTDFTDSEGRPPHSIEIVVDGGNTSDIAEVILDKKAGGIQTVGRESYDIATSYGDVVTIRFNRPEYLFVWMRVNLSANEAELPRGYSNIVIDSIVDDTTGMKAGEDLLTQMLNNGIYSSIPGITYIDIKCAVTNDSAHIPEESEYTNINVTASSRQKIVVTNTRIEVVCNEDS